MTEKNRLNGQIRTLIVDDDAYMRNYVRQLLEKIGFEHIDEASNGKQALKKIRKNGPDLVFLDVNMGRMNGLDLLRQVRVGSAGVPTDLPIIMMTVSDDDKVLGTALALDCDAFLSKPISQLKLAEKIWCVMSSTPVAKPAIAYKVVPVNIKTPRKPANEEKSLPEDAIVVSMEDLESDQVLASDIKNKRGKTLVAAGTRLNTLILNRLKNIAELMLFAIYEPGSYAGKDEKNESYFWDFNLFAMREAKSKLAIFADNLFTSREEKSKLALFVDDDYRGHKDDGVLESWDKYA